MSYWASPSSKQQPVILPLQRAGGSRCSVNPASTQYPPLQKPRSPNLRLGHKIQLPAWNGRASIKSAIGPASWIGPMSTSPLGPHLGDKLELPSSTSKLCNTL
ncbi:tubulin folding cofactor B [Striga asiatica]|uniref:Tubulin folding cofactor B n=1 Tax=Striga asiatica TaxID=4170 RepID=A0A5A7R1L7_STRAF|nr:tubulin folding cofactor B [Striga asiatica]